jgi:hypothetical protein
VALRPTLSSGLPLSGFSLPLPFGVLRSQEGQRSVLLGKRCASQYVSRIVMSENVNFYIYASIQVGNIEAHTLHVAPLGLKNLPGKNCPELPRHRTDEEAHILRPGNHSGARCEEASK